MRTCALLLGSIIFAGSSCQPQSTTAFNGGIPEGAKDLAAAISSAEQLPSFKKSYEEAKKMKMSQFTARLAAEMTDTKVEFNGRSYSGLKTAIAPHLKTMAARNNVDNAFGSLSDVFDAYGLDKSVTTEDLESYLKVADAGLKALSGEGTAVLDARTIV